MEKHIYPFLGSLVAFAMVLVGGGVTLFVGYWISDLLYDEGIWPIGALLRVVLLLELLGVGFTLLLCLLLAFRNLIFGDPDVH